MTKTQFWTGESVLDRDRDPFLGWGPCSGQQRRPSSGLGTLFWAAGVSPPNR